MSNPLRSGSEQVDAILFRAPLLQPTLHSLGPVLACVVGYVGVGWIGVHDSITGYWLPNSLLLAALLLHRPGWWWVALLPAIAAHLLSMPASAAPFERVCTLLCNEGLAGSAAVILHAIRRGYWFDEAGGLSFSQLILCMLLPPTLVLMLGSDTTWSTWLPASGLQLDCCLTAVLVSSLVGFVTVTPAIVTLCRNDGVSMTLRHLAGIVSVALLTVVICVGARFAQGALGQLILCALPVLALWSGRKLGFVGLGLCLLTAALLLQPADDYQLFLFATAVCSLAHTSIKLGQTSNLDALTQSLSNARARLRDSIERQNLMLRATHDAVVWWNIRRDSMRWSVNARAYFGGLLHTSGGWQLWSACIDADDRARVLEELHQFLDSGARLWRSEFQIRRRDGVLVPVRCRGILVRDVGGQPWRMVAALRDITDTRRAEQSARALARSARLATIGEITATITHEVNQPLAAILNNTETALLLLKDGTDRPDTIREILEDIRADDLRASQIVRRTRALLQHKELVRERIDLNDVVSRAINLLSDRARRTGIRLTLSLGPLPPLNADALHLEQVVINIVNNALDAAAAGPGRRQVDVFTCRCDSKVQVGVKDSGFGIPAADLERIFESFHTTKTEGLGLGLSLARAVVSMHGGRIFAENNKHGSGATVRVELPAVETYQPSLALSASK